MISELSYFPVYIELCYESTKLASGTGFVYKNSQEKFFLITNRHNVTGRHNETHECLSSSKAIPNNLKVHLHKKKPSSIDDRVIINIDLLENNSEELWIEHPFHGSKVDVVAVPFIYDNNSHIKLFDYSSSDSIYLSVTEEVSVIGFPHGKSNQKFPIWTSGTIASDPILNYNNLPILLINCNTTIGQSGSPVFAYRSSGIVSLENNGTINAFKGHELIRFIGIYSGRITAKSEIGLVWKAELLYQLFNHLEDIS